MNTPRHGRSRLSHTGSTPNDFVASGGVRVRAAIPRGSRLVDAGFAHDVVLAVLVETHRSTVREGRSLLFRGGGLILGGVLHERAGILQGRLLGAARLLACVEVLVHEVTARLDAEKVLLDGLLVLLRSVQVHLALRTVLLLLREGLLRAGDGR